MLTCLEFTCNFGMREECNYVCLMCSVVSHVRFLMASWTVACQAPLLWNLPGKNTGMVALPTPGDLPKPGIKPSSRYNFGIWLWKGHQLTMFLQQEL